MYSICQWTSTRLIEIMALGLKRLDLKGLHSLQWRLSERLQHAKSLDFLFDLILYAPSTIFQLNRDRSSWVEPVLS